MEEIDLLDTNWIDTSWIESYEEEEKHYNMFYPEPNKNIKVNILYINKNKDLEKINEKQIKLTTENVIKKEEWIKWIKDSEKLDKKKYKLISILIYNLNIENRELKNFLHNTEKYDFMTNLKNLDTYELVSTINCLQEINNIYIVLMEEDKKPGQHTKRVRFNILHSKTRKKKNHNII